MNKILRYRDLISSVLLVITVIIFSGSFYYLGFTEGESHPKVIDIKGLNNATSPSNITENFATFWEVWEELRARHIHSKDITDKQMVEGAIKGLAGSMDDSYTTYLNPSNSKKFGDDVRGEFGGIGAQISIKNEQLIVFVPLKGTPAENVGLKAKDMIVEIDGKSTVGMSVEDAVKIIRGPIGQKVILTIFREGWERTKKFEIIRQIIQVPTVDWEIDENKIMHLNLYEFNANANSLFAKAIDEGLAQGAKGLILDLRNNPGGFLSVAVDLSGWFLRKGDLVVVQRKANGNEESLFADGNEKLVDFPTVALINEGSASASEILAGALKIDRKVKLVGIKSFGKGTVQELYPLKDGGTLKITIANWLLPDGSLIDKNGIEPDYKIEITDEDANKKIDRQLDKATEILKTVINSKDKTASQ